MIFIEHWSKSLLAQDGATIKDAINSLEMSRSKIVLVVDSDSRLLGTITDGDIRRAILNGLGLCETVLSVICREPITATKTDSSDFIIRLMRLNGIDHVPILDANTRVCGLARLAKPLDNVAAEANMVVMAGGLGQRLGHLTQNTPKALMKIGDLTLIEKIILKAKGEGITKITISVNHLADQIIEKLGNGSAFGLNLSYVHEKRPLGTGGALKKILFDEGKPVLVSNCDVITSLKYRDLINFHIQNSADVTMALRQHVLQNDYGVVELDAFDRIAAFYEKPSTVSLINAGIYVINSSFSDFIEKDERVDMPAIIKRVIKSQGKAFGFPLYENWVDVGREDDLTFANNNEELF